MARCPNCGQETLRTKDWACQWCGYPLLSGSYKKVEKTYKELQQEKELSPAVEGETGPVVEEDEYPGPEPEISPDQQPEPEPEATEPVGEGPREPSPEVKPIPAPSPQEKPESDTPPVSPLSDAETAVVPPVDEEKTEPVSEPVANITEAVHLPPVLNPERELAAGTEPGPPQTEAPEESPVTKEPESIVQEPEPPDEPVSKVTPESPAEPVREVQPGPAAEPVPEVRPEPVPATVEDTSPSLDSIGDGTLISVDRLDTLFRADKLAVDEQMNGKMISVKGLVEKVVIRDHLDVRYVLLKGADKANTWNVRCSFEREQNLEMGRLSEGQSVVIKGIYDGASKNILFKNCVLAG